MINDQNSTEGANLPEGLSSVATSLLVECEAALAAGRVPEITQLSLAGLSPDELSEFERVRHCLDLLYSTVAPATTEGAQASHAPHSQIAKPPGTELFDGTRLGRFEVIRELGSGGQGVVFLARDPVLRREVALKLPRFEMLLTREMRERFVREGRAAAALGHPNVLTIFEANEIGPLCYLAQAYCAGPTLAVWLKQSRESVAPQIAAAIVSELADGVEHAHQRGILHRDLKPSNVMLEPLATEDATAVDRCVRSATSTRTTGRVVLPFIPKLADFGLAKVLETEAGETTVVAILGTAGYMSPEQAAGGQQEVGPTSDVYGLGTILFEILNGRPPFAGTTHVDILRKVTHEEPHWSPGTVSTTPRDLVSICRKCLEKDPRRRYGTARELAEDLRRYLAGEPTHARPAGTLERLAKWTRRKPAVAALAAVSIVSVVAFVALSAWSTVRMAHQRDLTIAAQRLTDALLYASNVQLASNALNVGHTEHANEFLDECIPGPGQEDHREFAWGYLRDELHAESATLRGHQGEVFAVAFSRDGQRLFSAGQDALIRVWDVASRMQIGAWSGHRGDVNQLGCSPDGKLLASVDDNGGVRIWDAQAGTLEKAFVVAPTKLYCAAFSPQGDLLVTAGEDDSIRLWDTATWKEKCTLAAGASVHTAVFSPDGKWLATSGITDMMRLWSVADGKLAAEYKHNQPMGLVFGDDGNSLFLGEANGGGVHRLPLDSRAPDTVWRLNEPYSIKQLLTFRDGDRMIALGGETGWSLWDAKRRKCLKRFYGHRGRTYDIAVRSQDELAATAGEDGTIKLWDISDQGLTPSVGLYTGISTMAQSPDGTLIGGAGGNAIRVWKAASGELVFSVTSLPAHNLSVCFSPDNRTVAATAEDGAVRLWSLDRAFEPRTIQAHEKAASTLAFHPSGNLLATGSLDATVRLWDLESAEQQGLWNANVAIKKIHFTADGESMLVASGTTLQRIDLASGTIKAAAQDHTSSIGAAAVSRDERMLATLERGSLIRIWDTGSFHVLRTLALHQVRAGHCAVAFHPSGDTLASIDTQSLSMWDLRTGRCLLTTSEPTFESCDGLQFAPDGTALFVSNGDYLHRLTGRIPAE